MSASTPKRDYYEVLGVARGADDAEIKKAFRRLARELHPDVNSEPDADREFTADVRGRFEFNDVIGIDGQVRYNRAVTDIDGFPPPNFLFMDTSDVAVSESVEAFGRIRITGPWDLKNEISVSDYQIERGDHGESGDSG